MSLTAMVGFFALLVGSYTDIKTREVPDWLSYALISMGMGMAAVAALTFQDVFLLLHSIVGLALFVWLGYLMFYTGQWGGGDSKLLMGLGALFGIPFVIEPPFIAVQDLFLLSFFVNLLFVGMVYAVLFSIYLAAKHWKKFSREFSRSLNKQRWASLLIAVAIISTVVFYRFFPHEPLYTIFGPSLVGIMVVGYYLLLFVRAVEKTSMFNMVAPKNLTEGDWIAKNVVIHGKRITGPKDLGISKKQISQLRAFAAKGKIKKVLVKEGIPFVPSFFVAYLLALQYGNLLLLWL